ncbi:hypothetical protein N8T08_006343 [Aspergillus melleus]|uniref:Uncharacterized protein n=1 Tax=Aspergillus melleus TaxID=138277 RepID=A0ACC3AZU3_9EURO|nr:hypothetical protein N8T08_006343 [Aspergillus melleus]
MESSTKYPAAPSSDIALSTYSTTLKALQASNDKLQQKMTMLRSSTLRLELDLMKLQRHIRSFDKELLMTWQADTLTRLIEVIYERHRWKMPGGIVIGDHQGVHWDTLSTLYAVAARKIKKDTLKRRFGLSVQYYDALQKYDEIVPVRSIDPYESECSFAKWLVTEKERRPGLYQFWGKLFPLCYGRTVEETAGRF